MLGGPILPRRREFCVHDCAQAGAGDGECVGDRDGTVFVHACSVRCAEWGRWVLIIGSRMCFFLLLLTFQFPRFLNTFKYIVLCTHVAFAVLNGEGGSLKTLKKPLKRSFENWKHLLKTFEKIVKVGVRM